MPMDFPNMKSLEKAAEVHGFRQPEENESEEEFREKLADYVFPIDWVKSYEIRFGIGWNKWSDDQQLQSIRGVLNK